MASADTAYREKGENSKYGLQDRLKAKRALTKAQELSDSDCEKKSIELDKVVAMYKKMKIRGSASGSQ